MQVGVEDLDTGGQGDVLGCDLARSGHHQRRLDLAGVGVHAADDALEVEHDVGDVLLDALNGGELVRNALDTNAGDGGACEG